MIISRTRVRIVFEGRGDPKTLFQFIAFMIDPQRQTGRPLLQFLLSALATGGAFVRTNANRVGADVS